MSENGHSPEITTHPIEIEKHRSRLKPALMAGLVLVTSACDGEVQPGKTATAFKEFFQHNLETLQIEDDAMESLLEKSEDGIEGDFRTFLTPEFRDLSLNSKFEFGFAFQKREDGKWHMVGLKRGTENVIKHRSMHIINLANSYNISESFIVHNHTIHDQVLLDPGKYRLNIISSDNQLESMEFTFTQQGLSEQEEMIRQGQIPPPPFPPSVTDTIYHSVSQANYLDNVASQITPINGMVTGARGLWEFTCEPTAKNQLQLHMGDGRKIRDLSQFPYTPDEKEYQMIQSLMSLPYTDDAISAFKNNNPGKVQEEYNFKQTYQSQLIVAAEKIGCKLHFTSYEDLEKNSISK